MVAIGLDSNLLVYAEIHADSDKGRRSISLIEKSAGGVIPAQALGELMRVAQRKAPALLPGVCAGLDRYRKSFRISQTTDSTIAAAAALAREHKLQFWDCVICVAAAQAGATVLLSEDMQDGMDIRGLKIVNPFDKKNDALVERLLG